MVLMLIVTIRKVGVQCDVACGPCGLRCAEALTAREYNNCGGQVRYALLACFLHVRAMEVTDDATRMAIDLIHLSFP
jgi:hypothetical protein